MTNLHDVDDLFRKRFYERTFIGLVTSTSGNRVSISRPGSTVAEGPYPATAGLAASLVPGDRVLVLVTGGTPIVLQEIAT